MILSDKKILEEMKRGTIVITPFNRKYLGSNSYDVHLGKYLAMYEDEILDAKHHNKVRHFEIPKDGLILVPSKLYLGVIGRLGIDIHATAGKGDVGFCNTWTLEISVRQPVRVYAGMPIGQLIYFAVDGDVEILYNKKKNAKYNKRTIKPVESMMWKNFRK